MVSNSEFVVPFPKVLRLEPASSCNFQCIHCPTGLGLNSSLGIMNDETFNKIYEQIKNYRFRVIVLYHGGEPLLNKNFFVMLKKLKPLAEKVSTVTNGSFLNESIIEQILDSGIDEINISLDGSSPEENNRIRIGSDFKQITDQIKKLIILRNQRDLKKPKIFIANAQIPTDLDKTDRIDTSTYLLEAFKEVLKEIEFKSTYTIMWPGMPQKYPSPKPKGNFCDNIMSTITIRWNGDVVPCCYDLVNMMVMGNVLNEKIESIWNNDKYVKLRRDIQEFHPPALCKNCIVLQSKKRTKATAFLG